MAYANFMAQYRHKIATSTVDTDGPFNIDVAPALEAGLHPSAKRIRLGKILRDAGILLPNSRVREFRIEGDALIVFPTLPGLTTYHHSVSLIPAGGL